MDEQVKQNLSHSEPARGSKISNGVYLFFGEDDFSIHRKIALWKSEFAKKHAGSDIISLAAEDLSELELAKLLEDNLAPSLFSSKKLIIAKNFLPTKAAQAGLTEKILEIIEKIPADYFLVFWQTQKPDRRLSSIKKILSSAINVQEFKLPHERELNAWIVAEGKRQGITIEPSAVEKLAQSLGRDLFEAKKAGGKIVDIKEAFDLWQASSELAKLASFSANISVSDVEKLVNTKVSENVFVLSDSIMQGREKEALSALENLLNAGSDEKSEIIKLTGLLAEQLRSSTLIYSLKARNISQEQMAEVLGWSPGRVFMVSKGMGRFDLTRAKNLLARLLTIDQSLKSSEASPKLLFDLFIHQACV